MSDDQLSDKILRMVRPDEPDTILGSIDSLTNESPVVVRDQERSLGPNETDAERWHDFDD